MNRPCLQHGNIGNVFFFLLCVPPPLLGNKLIFRHILFLLCSTTIHTHSIIVLVKMNYHNLSKNGISIEFFLLSLCQLILFMEKKSKSYGSEHIVTPHHLTAFSNLSYKAFKQRKRQARAHPSTSLEQRFSLHSYVNNFVIRL